MKTVAFLILITWLATVALAEDFKTISGKEYKNATVTHVESDGIVLKTKSGISKVYFTELPKEVQERFHYVPAKASAPFVQNTARPNNFGHDDVKSAAVKSADDFLAALKIFELSEGKRAIAETAWPSYLDELPVLLENEKLFDGMFPTDAPGVLGYKRLVQAKVQSEGGAQLTQKYLLVSYSDKESGRWRVWAFIKIAGIDVDHEIQAAREALKEYANYRNYAFWLGIGGRLLAAKQTLASVPPTTYAGDGGAYYKRQDMDTVAAIESICGK